MFLYTAHEGHLHPEMQILCGELLPGTPTGSGGSGVLNYFANEVI